MPENRVTQLELDLVYASEPNIRVSQESVEASRAADGNIRVSQESIEAIHLETPPGRVTQTILEVLRSPGDLWLTQMALEVLRPNVSDYNRAFVPTFLS